MMALLGPLKGGRGLFQLGMLGRNSELLGKHGHSMATYGMCVALDERWLTYS